MGISSFAQSGRKINQPWNTELNYSYLINTEDSRIIVSMWRVSKYRQT